MEALTVLSKELTKVTRPKWWRLVYAGWALFAVSFLLPAYVEHGVIATGISLQGPSTGVPIEIGADAFMNALLWGGRVGKLSALTNLLILASLLALRTSRPGYGRWLRWPVGAAGVLNLVYWPIWMVGEGDPISYLLVGYWSWVASFFCVAGGLWTVARKQGPAPAPHAHG